jgi:hypothetical protein
MHKAMTRLRPVQQHTLTIHHDTGYQLDEWHHHAMGVKGMGTSMPEKKRNSGSKRGVEFSVLLLPRGEGIGPFSRCGVEDRAVRG